MTETALTAKFALTSPDATAALAEWLAPRLVAGDVVLLDGPIGAGKSHFCRAIIQTRLASVGMAEDVPSPTFTLVQVYDLPEVSIWHADLYRLSSADQAVELGLEDAFEDAITLIEWPDRLGQFTPKKALTLHISYAGDPETRNFTFSASDPRWRATLTDMSEKWRYRAND